MAETIHILAVIVGVVIPILILLHFSSVGRRPAGYPPGPPTLPLIGNIHQVRCAMFVVKIELTLLPRES